MCGLCGIFGSEDHWTSGVISAPTADPVARRQERFARIKAVNSILKKRRLSLRDWQGQQYVLEGGTGKGVIIDNITEIWAAMDADFGGAFDPLDLTEIEQFPENGESK